MAVLWYDAGGSQGVKEKNDETAIDRAKTEHSFWPYIGYTGIIEGRERAIPMPVPREPKIYHIVHVDRLPSIIAAGHLWCDSEMVRHPPAGTTIGMNRIKQRRLTELSLSSHPDLHVGDCVPFYFCPRSVMLYLIYKRNPELTYHGGQSSIIHLEADLRQTVAWAEANGWRWAFTLSNAGAKYFEDRCALSDLNQIQWDAVEAKYWQDSREGKQAEFLLENRFPWELVSRIGVHVRRTYEHVVAAVHATKHRPHIQIQPEWYY